MYEFVFMLFFEDLWRIYVKDSKFFSFSEVFRVIGLLIILNDFVLDFLRFFEVYVKVVGFIFLGKFKLFLLDKESFIFDGDLIELVVVLFGIVILNFKSEFVDSIVKGFM